VHDTVSRTDPGRPGAGRGPSGRGPSDRGRSNRGPSDRGRSNRGPSDRGPDGPTAARRRRGDPTWARRLVVFGALLMMVSGGVLVGGKLVLNRYTGAIPQDSLIGDAAATDGKGRVSISGAINLLLVGVDESADRQQAGLAARADSILIAHIPAQHDQAYLVSIPRDSYVEIPAYPKAGFTGAREKINAAFVFGSQRDLGRSGGFELLALTVQRLSGIRFNGGAIVNFDGFKAIVDALGGIDMYVDDDVQSIHIGWDKQGRFAKPFRLNPDGTVAAKVPGVTPQTYHPGQQHLSSWQALDYCRQRDLLGKGDSDYGRQRHQQQFIKAVMKQTVSRGVVTNPAKLDKVLRAAGKALTFDSGGVPIEDWIFTLKGINPDNLTTVKTNAGTFNSRTVQGGQSAEILTEESLHLLAAIRDDRVADFVLKHPDWVSA
jgi:polyisoprenyl-teichoic acid--peptidoglycan teichoic acid transferase